jgi:hypothetical protein
MSECRNLSHLGRSFAWALAVSALWLALPVAAQAPAPFPPPIDVISHIDQHCFRPIEPQHPVNIPLTLTHLNPILVEAGFPKHDVVLRDPQDLCVPVQKEDEEPKPEVLKIVRWLDWECFGIDGKSLDYRLRIDQLNPVIQHLIGPRDELIVRKPEQLCVPVAKDYNYPPDDVIKLISYLDVECFGVEARQPLSGQTIKLTHQNPLLEDLPRYEGKFTGHYAFQLCVPVAKNGDIPQDDIIKYVAYTDVLCYELDAPPLDRSIKLSQLDPQLIDRIDVHKLGPFKSHKLCVPVAKNGLFPPG